jgi:hypothetical protein
MRHPWKMVVRTAKGKPLIEARSAVAATILEAGGMPLRLRKARTCLFLLSRRANEGLPAIVDTEGGFVCLIALDDLVDVIVEPEPTLKEVMEEAGVKPRARRKASHGGRSAITTKAAK